MRAMVRLCSTFIIVELACTQIRKMAIATRELTLPEFTSSSEYSQYISLGIIMPIRVPSATTTTIKTTSETDMLLNI